MDRDLPQNGEIWRHFKDKLYKIVAIAQHTETDEKLVVYQAINDLSDYLKFVFKAWDDEHEEEPDLLSYNMVYSEVCRRADEECFPPDEWAEDKYWWSFRHPLDNEVKRIREKVDYDDARNKKWNKKSGPHNSEGPILLVTK